MSLKILILVLSSKKPPYDMLYQTQRDTWDAVDVMNVSSLYYWCDDFDTMIQKFATAIHAIMKWDWDFIFRTNSSSYIDKQRLLDQAQTLPLNKAYQCIGCSGAGFFLSRDLVSDLCHDLVGHTHTHIPEDVVIWQTLQARNINLLPGAMRSDIWPRPGRVVVNDDSNVIDFADEKRIKNAYHVRCKSDTSDRQKDVFAMKIVHHIKYSSKVFNQELGF